MNGLAEQSTSRPVALVTGGSRGIGAATACALARKGFDVAVVYAGNEAAARSTVDEITQLGATARAYRCDVSQETEVTACVQAILGDFGSVWALINNAGITRDGLLARMSDKDFDDVMNVNLKGAFHMIRALSRTFIRQRKGRIINVSSVVGIMGNAGQANYAASKAGLIGLTKSVAREFASRGITCNAVAPGFVKTAMTSELSDAKKAQYELQIPLGYLCECSAVADVIAFLASDEAAYITGAVIPVDGGMSM